MSLTAEEISRRVQNLRDYFNTGVTKSLAWRTAQLKGLMKMCKEKEKEWIEALREDLGAHTFESGLLVAAAQSDVDFYLKNLAKWMEPKSVPNPWSLYPGTTQIVPEPYGVVLDFVPFNYPFFLGVTTLAPIIAAGNVCCFKPSSNTPACARLFQEYLPQYLDPRGIEVMCGPTSICDTILNERFDYIFYTGSPRVAHNIMAKAAAHLTPVLLELGGKSPVYFDSECSLEKCAKRLVWGKVFNGGQTCVAPDYVLVKRSRFEEIKNAIVKAIGELYGDITKPNDNITHIINSHHFDRLQQAIETSGGNIVLRGVANKDTLQMNPVVIENPSLDSQLMTEEIFGPIFPLVPVEDEDEAIRFINEREKPLALYILTSRKEIFTKFQNQTSSGALMQNDVVFHTSSSQCPFGGVGNSGMGQYHGKTGFKALSHMKPVLSHSTIVDVSIRLPPYNLNYLKVLQAVA